MERQIAKRETIAVRGKHKANSGSGMTTNQLKKKVGDIRSKLNKASSEANALEEQKLRMTQRDSDNRSEVSRLNDTITQLQADQDGLQAQIMLRAFAKQKNLMDLTRAQTMEKQLKIIEDGTYQMKLTEDELESEQGKVAEKSRKIMAVIGDLQATFPQLQQQLSMVL